MYKKMLLNVNEASFALSVGIKAEENTFYMQFLLTNASKLFSFSVFI